MLSSLAAAVWLHLAAGLTLPLPVGDEVVFYYPALALAETGTLHSPHLHASRELFWMPPGYMILLAGWLKAAGAGLAQARWFSFALAALAYLLWANLFKRWGLGWAGLALLSAAFLARHWVVMGNFVRMEGLELCLWALGLLALDRGNRWAALSWFLVSLAVHPNGVYFCGYWVLASGIIRFKKEAGLFRNILYALPGLLVAFAYGVYALMNWPEFLNDWRHQLGTRQPGGLALLLFRADQAVFLGMWAGCAWTLFRDKDLKALWRPLDVAGVLWLVRMLGQGWSYGVFNILAVTVTAAVAVVLALKVLFPRLTQFNQKIHMNRWVRPALVAAVVAALVVAKVYSVPGLWRTYEWQGMMPEAGYPTLYLTPADREAVLKRLRLAGKQLAQAKGRPVRVYVIPEGEGMLLGSKEEGLWMHVLPTFGSQLPDYLLWHRSGKGTFFASAESDLAGIINLQNERPFYSRRDSDMEPAEKWYFTDLMGRYPAFILPPDSAKNSQNEAR